MSDMLARRLGSLRRGRGLSQEELARKVGVSRQAISKWECGESCPSTENLIALAAIYETDLNGLCGQGAAETREESGRGTREGHPEGGATRRWVVGGAGAVVIFALASFLLLGGATPPKAMAYEGTIIASSVTSDGHGGEFVLDLGPNAAPADSTRYLVVSVDSNTQYYGYADEGDETVGRAIEAAAPEAGWTVQVSCPVPRADATQRAYLTDAVTIIDRYEGEGL